MKLKELIDGKLTRPGLTRARAPGTGVSSPVQMAAPTAAPKVSSKGKQI